MLDNQSLRIITNTSFKLFNVWTLRSTWVDQVCNSHDYEGPGHHYHIIISCTSFSSDKWLLLVRICYNYVAMEKKHYKHYWFLLIRDVLPAFYNTSPHGCNLKQDYTSTWTTNYLSKRSSITRLKSYIWSLHTLSVYEEIEHHCQSMRKLNP